MVLMYCELVTNLICFGRFLMRFTGNESEINSSSGVKDTEFSEWKWTGPAEVIEQVHRKASLNISSVNLLLNGL